jgi:hypothetical protein
VLFQRSIVPAPGFFGSGTTTFSSTPVTGALGNLVVPNGVTVNNSINPAALPGFNFNNPSIPLPNNPVVAPGVVGYQGLGSLGVGRVSPTSGIGGFVFSAASDSFNLLIRALKTQQRIDVLSRPQIQTLDNQAAEVTVGQWVPYTLGSTITGTGLAQQNIQYRNVGVDLVVIPKISPDGKVIMRVTPQISSLSQTPLSLGNGVTAPIFNQQLVDTTVIARDGETVAIGGLITMRDTKTENKIPWFGDLPGVGALFRYRTQAKAKQELLVIMTPHIVRNRFEADRILAEEAHRMDWIVGDVIKTQGPSGLDPIFPPPPGGAVPPPPPLPSPSIPTPAWVIPVSPGAPFTPVAPGDVLPVPTVPPPGAVVPGAPPPVPGVGVPPAADGVLPAPRPAEVPPGAAGPGPAAGAAQGLNLAPGAAGAAAPAAPPPAVNTTAQPGSNTPAAPGGSEGTTVPSAAATTAPAPQEQGKESGRWRLFRR